MLIFPCPRCGSVLSFEDASCPLCGTAVAFSRSARGMVPLDAAGAWRSEDGRVTRRCANERIGCNWLAAAGEQLCFACALTRSIPEEIDEAVAGYLADTGLAKRRLIFQLDELGLPIRSHLDQPDGGLAFDLDASTDDKKVMIGHLNGVISIDVTEAKDSHREALRAILDEAYRTMLGHFRHEIGHYYWQILVWPDQGRLDSFRTLFGDERQDYGAALDAHYADSPRRGAWQDRFISQYATTHPWEDFAETFAHFLHITDTLQTAAAQGLHLELPEQWPAEVRTTNTSRPVLHAAAGIDARRLLTAWEPLAVALNRMNRSMGKTDLYPFTIPEPVEAKLGYVLDLVRSARSAHRRA